MIYIKKYFKYILFFFVFLLILIFCSHQSADNLWNYGMAHAIRIGEIPYKDFNIISTPLYPFIMSIGLFIKDTYLVYLIEQSILCCVLVYLFEKLVGNKYLILLSIIVCPLIVFILPNYNFLFFILMVLIIYFEKEKKSDFLIGLLLGFLFITKHTMGIFVIFFSLISTRKIKRMGIRFISSLIPITVFILYLIITRSFYSFIDLSILGLFDFGGSNSDISIVGLIIILIVLMYSIISIIRDKDNINNYYLIGAISFVIPMVELFHLFYLIVFFILILLLDNKVNSKYFFVISFTLMFLFYSLFISYNKFSNYRYNSLDKFKYYLVIGDDSKKYYEDVFDKYSKYNNSYMISMNSIIFDVSSNKKITYFNIPLNGNFGYKGTDKMIKKIDSMHDVHFFVQESKSPQFSSELIDEIRRIGKYTGSVQGMEIYYLE